MDVRIFTEPQQGATYEQLLAAAQLSERLGYSAFFRSDHYMVMGDGNGYPGPTDAWVTLGALARETSTIRLGTLVTSATFRLPGVLAMQVAQVDAMSNGRIELGLGAGWYEVEHTAYGIPFPSLGDRFERLEEQLAIVSGLWATPLGEQFSFAGKHYQLTDSPALPKPTQTQPPIIMGGYGPRRTPRLAASYANEFNLPFTPLSYFSAGNDIVTAACETQGRDPQSLIRSVALVLCIGNTESELQARATKIGRDLRELRENGAAGTPNEVIAKLRAFGDAGATRVYLQLLDLDDLDQLQLVAADVLPHLTQSN